MRRYAILLEKKSQDGSTKTRWCIAGSKQHDLNYVEATCNIRQADLIKRKPDGGPVAFCAQALIIWDCEDLTPEMRHVIENWANGDFTLDSSST